jgi:hypothetical protein
MREREREKGTRGGVVSKFSSFVVFLFRTANSRRQFGRGKILSQAKYKQFSYFLFRFEFKIHENFIYLVLSMC